MYMSYQREQDHVVLTDLYGKNTVRENLREIETILKYENQIEALQRMLQYTKNEMKAYHRRKKELINHSIFSYFCFELLRQDVEMKQCARHGIIMEHLLQEKMYALKQTPKDLIQTTSNKCLLDTEDDIIELKREIYFDNFMTQYQNKGTDKEFDKIYDLWVRKYQLTNANIKRFMKDTLQDDYTLDNSKQKRKVLR